MPTKVLSVRVSQMLWMKQTQKAAMQLIGQRRKVDEENQKIGKRNYNNEVMASFVVHRVSTETETHT